MTTVKDFLTTTIAAAERRGYDRAVAELQATINEITGHAVARSETTASEALTRAEQRTLEAIRANPGSTIADIKKNSGLRSAGAAYTLLNRGLVRKEGSRFAPKGSSVPAVNQPRIRFYPV